MFVKDETVVYPGHGVAKIEDIVVHQFHGSSVTFFKLIFLFKDMTILVPTYNVDSIGLRKPCARGDIDTVLDEISRKASYPRCLADVTPGGWNKRQKEYQLKVESGNLSKVASVYRDLMVQNKNKELSFGEKNLLQITEHLIAQEIHVVTSYPYKDVVFLLRKPFATQVLVEGHAQAH